MTEDMPSPARLRLPWSITGTLSTPPFAWRREKWEELEEDHEAQKLRAQRTGKTKVWAEPSPAPTLLELSSKIQATTTIPA